MATYIIMTQPITLPGTVRGISTQRVAVVEIEPGYSGRPPAISVRAPGVRRVVQEWTGGLPALVAAEAAKARLEERANTACS